MILLDIIKYAATMLSKNAVLGYVTAEGGYNETNSYQPDMKTAINLSNMVIKELALAYIPITKKESVVFVNGLFDTTDLSENVRNIIRLTDAEGKDVPFKVEGEYMRASVTGAVIEYSYIPDDYSPTQVIGYTDKDISPVVLAYGLCAEWCIVDGRFDEAVMWHKRYMDKIAAMLPPKNVTVKKRSFI